MATGLVTTIADFATTLASGVAIGATTATLTSATDSDGVALPTGTYGFTIDRKNSAKEYIECTLTSTALTAIKTVARGTGVATSGFARAHRKGAEVIISDFVAIKRVGDVLDTGYAGATTPTTDYQLATKKYVDDTAIAGGSNATTTTQGFVELGTQAEVDAGTATGATGASLVATPALIRAKAYHDYAVDSVGSDAYAITITPAITAYAAGQVFTFKAGTANTGASTLAVSGLAAKSIKKNVSSDLVTGDILQNQIITVVYDGTNMQLINKTIVNAATELTGVLPVANGGTGTAIMLKAGVTTRTISTASGAQTIAHGLGATPSVVYLYATVNKDQPGPSMASSRGIYNAIASTTNTIWEESILGTSTSGTTGQDTTNGIYIDGEQVATVSVDGTNITLTWTKSGTSTGTDINILWEAR